MSLGVFPLRVEVKDVTIGDDPSFGSKVPFAQVGELDVSIALLPLLSKNIEVESLELKQAKIEIIRNAQGIWNFSTAGSSSHLLQRSRRLRANRKPSSHPHSLPLPHPADSLWAN